MLFECLFFDSLEHNISRYCFTSKIHLSDSKLLCVQKICFSCHSLFLGWKNGFQ